MFLRFVIWDQRCEAKYILEIVRKIDADEIEFEAIDGSLTKSVGTLQSSESMECVQMSIRLSTSPNRRYFALKETLKKVILQTSFATSDKETRPLLTGVNFHNEGNTFILSYQIPIVLQKLD